MERIVDSIYTFKGKVEDVENDYIVKVQKKLKSLEDKQEQGLLYRKVYMIKPSCYKPRDCEGDCDVCPSNELEVDSEIILYSQYDKEKHYDSAWEAEEALAKMGDTHGSE